MDSSTSSTPWHECSLSCETTWDIARKFARHDAAAMLMECASIIKSVGVIVCGSAGCI